MRTIAYVLGLWILICALFWPYLYGAKAYQDQKRRERGEDGNKPK